MKYLVLLFVLFSCSNTPVKEPVEEPGVVKPEEPVKEPVEEKPYKVGKKIRMWSTYYFTPIFASSQSKKYYLRDPKGNPISGKLTLDEWCFIGLQGSGRVDNQTYKWAASNSTKRVPCERSFMRNLSYAYSTGKIKYKKEFKCKYGTGNKVDCLLPIKTVACQQGRGGFKYGQRFYIPAAKTETTSGIFECKDIGGAIKGNKIDTFIGFVDLRGVPMSKVYSHAGKYLPPAQRKYVKSTSKGTFDAYLIEDKK